MNKILRNPKKLIYSSSPDRGLIYLLKMWPEIIKAVPDALLDVYYGFDVFDAIHKGNPGRMKWKSMIIDMMKQPGITYHGRVGHKELEQAMMGAGILSYPTDFTEISCQPEDAFVQTINGDKKISELTIKDRAITHLGNVRDITAIRKRPYNKIMYTIVSQCGEEFRVTGEHPIFSIQLDKPSRSKSYAENIKLEKKWIEAKNISIGDLIVIPKLKKIYGDLHIELGSFKSNRINNLPTEKNNLPDKILIDKELAWFLGYFAGDGNASPRGKVSVLVADTHMGRDYEKVILGMKKFGLPITERKLSGCTEVQIYSYQLSRVLTDLFYINKIKTLPRDIYVRFPDEVFSGLMAADGYSCIKDEHGVQGAFTNKSKMLISIMRDLLSYRGLTGKTVARHHKDTNGSISYSISWTEYKKDQKQRFYLDDNDYIYLKVRKKLQSDFNGYVYNIDVEEDNSYLTGGISVHNCITAMKAQALGAIPVVTNYAALKETVKNGLKIDMDITTEEGQKEYLKQLIGLLKDEKEQELIRKPMMKWAQEYFTWDKVAFEWDKLFRINLQNPELMIAEEVTNGN